MVDVIDLTHEPPPGRLEHAIDGPWAWLAADLDPADCVVALDDACMEEVGRLAADLRLNPLPTLLRGPGHIRMPALRARMRLVKARLDEGPGLAVVDAMPMDDLDREEATALFWILGQLLGQAVAQKWDGTMLYHVRDTGQPYSYGVRGSTTNVELGFHTDNAFGVAPPDSVGLLCINPSREGGVSRFCSLYTVHNRLLGRYPRALERLYRPLFWDRQAEHAPGRPKVARAPMFGFDGRRLRSRVNVSLVRKGYDIAGEAMDAETADALAALEDVTRDPAMWFELPLERGHLQYLNNHEVAHYRGAFKDHEDPALKRHLVRSWHRNHGRASYDG